MVVGHGQEIEAHLFQSWRKAQGCFKGIAVFGWFLLGGTIVAERALEVSGCHVCI